MVLIVRAMNTGISDRGLFTHLSDPVAGNIRDLGHKKPEEPVVYSYVIQFVSFMPSNFSSVLTVSPCRLAVKYLFLADRVQ